MTSMTVSEARAAMPDLLARVDRGEEVTITRHGRPVAVVVRPDVLRARRASAALQGAGRVHDLLAAARRVELPSAGGLSAERADEIIADIRAGRDAR